MKLHSLQQETLQAGTMHKQQHSLEESLQKVPMHLQHSLGESLQEVSIHLQHSLEHSMASLCRHGWQARGF